MPQGNLTVVGGDVEEKEDVEMRELTPESCYPGSEEAETTDEESQAHSEFDDERLQCTSYGSLNNVSGHQGRSPLYDMPAHEWQEKTNHDASAFEGLAFRDDPFGCKAIAAAILFREHLADPEMRNTEIDAGWFQYRVSILTVKLQQALLGGMQRDPVAFQNASLFAMSRFEEHRKSRAGDGDETVRAHAQRGTLSGGDSEVSSMVDRGCAV